MEQFLSAEQTNYLVEHGVDLSKTKFIRRSYITVYSRGCLESIYERGKATKGGLYIESPAPTLQELLLILSKKLRNRFGVVLSEVVGVYQTIFYASDGNVLYETPPFVNPIDSVFEALKWLYVPPTKNVRSPEWNPLEVAPLLDTCSTDHCGVGFMPINFLAKQRIPEGSIIEIQDPGIGFIEFLQVLEVVPFVGGHYVLNTRLYVENPSKYIPKEVLERTKVVNYK